MKISVRLYGSLRGADSQGHRELEIPVGATAADAIAALDLRPGEVWLIKQADQLIDTDTVLQPGDKLALIPPVGGGSG
jgi:molybdopterin converting factor small subunit